MSWVAAVLGGLAAIRTAYLLIRMELHLGSVQRFHVEAAAFLFVAVSLLSRALSPPRSTSQRRSVEARRRPAGALAGIGVAGIALALVTYAPALHVGFLSDDLVLINRVISGHFGAVSVALFRPVPLLLWAIVLKVGGGALALHTLNVVMHGVNAFLVYRVVAGWTDEGVVSAAAGLLFLMTPLAVEPVTWCSGVFDVTATFFCLSALLAARCAEDSLWAFVLALLCAILAILCKESAVVLPGLLLLDVAIRRSVARKQATLILIDVVLSVIYSGVRLMIAFGPAHPPISKYLVQRALFYTFGALAVPLPVSVSPLWFAVAGTLVIVLLTHLLLFNRDVGKAVPILLAIWCVACIVPIYPIVFVSRNLEGSRDLYESMVGWSALVSLAGLSRPPVARIARAARMGLVCALVAINVFAVRAQLQAWTSAAALRDSVKAAARANDAMRQCLSVGVSDLPDSVSGAYVLRNGGTELLRSVGVTVGSPANGCRFKWSSAHRQFVRSD